MEYLFWILVIVLLVRWAVLSSRLRRMEQRIEEESARHGETESRLLQRLANLEVVAASLTASAKSVPGQPTEAPVSATVPTPAKPALSTGICQFCGRQVEPGVTVCACGAAVRVDQRPVHAALTPPPIPAALIRPSTTQPSVPPRFLAPEPVAALINSDPTQPATSPHVAPPPLRAAEPLPPPIPQLSLRDRLRAKVGDQEWEAMVGGSWLNKIGVLILVIGIALLLGLEFTRVGAAGRVAMGLGVSLIMLIGGVLIERRPLYAIFGRGLIGGGWAALYFTTYAMHAVDAARVIDNPYVGMALLLAVACGMIAHSLRYHSQTVTGLAYFIAFATLALSESTPFSVLALIPLAGSLLMLAYRFDWTKMAVFGLFATYATCASRPDSGAPLGSTQALFGCYWLLFESFDIMRIQKGRRGFRMESLILPMNALGFLALSLVKWQRSAPVHLYLALSAGAALYLASALLRVVMRRRAASTDSKIDWIDGGDSTLDRMASGEYEGPITLSAALAALAIFRKASGPWIGAGLLIEGEVLFLAGMQFGQTYLRQLAGAVFTTSVARILGFDVPAGGKTVIAGREWVTWSPVAISAAVVFYVNRVLRKQALNLIEGTLYSSVAAALISLVLAYETPQQYLCVAWIVFGTVLFELGVRTRKIEFLYQSYVLGVLGTGAGLLANVFVSDPTWQRPWLPIAIVAALHYGIALRMRSVDNVDGVNDTARWCASASAVAFLSALVWKLAPSGYLGLAWLLLGAAIFELGMRKLPAQFRGLSYLVSAGAFARLLYFDVVLMSKDSVPAVAMSLGFAALVCYAMSARVFRPAQDTIEPTSIQRDLAAYRDLNCAAATLFLLTLIWLKLPVAVVALAWAVVGLVILEIGFSFSLARFRIIGNLTAHAAFGRLFLANFTNLGDTLRISHRMLTALPIAISEYYVWWRYRNADVPPAERSWARVYLYAPAILIFVLMRFELGRSVAVVGWALLCVALFRTGLALKIADFRWQSYAIAIVAFWRCWNTNFYIPESLAGMPGRVVAGTAVIVSFYVAQLMAPRAPAEGTLGFLDRHARTFYSLLGSVLLAAMLFYEVSGGVLTMAWGTEALLLLGAGFPLRDRLQRLSGLFLFLVCVLKLFFFDLRQLETINRILSFIVLGVILVSVSWIYTRFRDRIQRYL